MKKIFPWIIVALTVIGYFIFIHQANNKESVIKREPKSLFKYEEEQLMITITQFPRIESNNTYTSANDFSSFEIHYPDNWATMTNTTATSATTTFHSTDKKNTNCVMIFQSQDNMPLLEALNYNQFMIEKENTPFFLKDTVETTISGAPAHVSKLRIDSKKTEEFVHNVVIVQDNKYTTILRSCPGTTDEIFYPILKSFKMI